MKHPKRTVVGMDPDTARRLTFSAATLIQHEPITADDWSTIADDLERAAAAARRTADQLARTEDEL